MILVDTSVWIDHLHRADRGLAELLEQNVVATHPTVIGELALGTIQDRSGVLTLLERLPAVTVAREIDVRRLVEDVPLRGRGLSLVDAHLLASTLITPGCAGCGHAIDGSPPPLGVSQSRTDPSRSTVGRHGRVGAREGASGE